jgi:transcriptional regulator with XRE-family HTH domain
MDKKPTLKEWLKITGQTYKDFAQKMDMKYQAIERIANNKDIISFKKALAIWKATGYEVRLISLYPNLGPVIEDISHIDKSDLKCESIGGRSGKYPDSIV